MAKTMSVFLVSNRKKEYSLVFCSSIGLARRKGRELYGSELLECRPATKQEIANKREIIDLGE